MANLYAEDALLMPPGAPAVTGRANIKTFLGEDAAKSKAAGVLLKNNTVTGAGVSGDTGWIKRHLPGPRQVGRDHRQRQLPFRASPHGWELAIRRRHLEFGSPGRAARRLSRSS